MQITVRGRGLLPELRSITPKAFLYLLFLELHRLIALLLLDLALLLKVPTLNA
jgi:hypothetical protein